MAVNHTGSISTVLACSLLLSLAGCSVDEEAATSTSNLQQAVHGDSPAFRRIFGPPRRENQALAEELTEGQSRLCQLQADIVGDSAGNGLDDDDPDDGGWDFTVDTSATEHSASASPSNTYGVTALALVVRGTENQRALGCALDAALGMQARPEVDSPPDFVFWVVLGDIFDNPGFAELAAVRYDAKVSEAGSAQALGESIRDLRHSQGNDGLIGYDLAWLTFAAIALDTALPDAGYGDDAEVYAGIIASDLTSDAPLFDMNDGSEAFYTDGLSWSLLALDSVHRLPQLQATLKELLLEQQLENGAFGYNEDFPEPDLQATSGALLALEFAGNGSDQLARRAAISYLVDQQTEDGGWDVAPGLEGTQANADILFALTHSREAPFPPESGSALPATARRSSLGTARALAAPAD